MKIKERILQIVEDKGLSKEYFFSDLGYSSSNFRSKQLKSQVGSEVIEKIISKYGVSAHWLLTGEGSMYKESKMVSDPAAPYNQVANPQKIIELYKRIDELHERVFRLEEENKVLRSNLPGAGSSKAV